MKQRWFLLLITLAAWPLAIGCGPDPRKDSGNPNRYRAPGQGGNRPTEPPTGVVGPPRPVEVVICNKGTPQELTYYYDHQTNRWYYIDANGQRVYGAPGQNPPCAPNWIPPPPPPTPRRADIGLQPDANGMVAPMVWFLDHVPPQPGQYHVDDRLDFFMVAERNWILPFDTDEALRNAIGAGNIHAYEFPVESDGLGDPIAIHLHGVRLEDAITVLTRLGVNEIAVNWPEGVFQLRLDGAPDDYKRALLYKDGNLIEKITLR